MGLSTNLCDAPLSRSSLRFSRRETLPWVVRRFFATLTCVTLHACGSSRKVIFLGDQLRGTGFNILALGRVQLLDLGSEDLSQAPLFYRLGLLLLLLLFLRPPGERCLPSARSSLFGSEFCSPTLSTL